MSAPTRRPRGKDFGAANTSFVARLDEATRLRIAAWAEWSGKGVERCEACYFPQPACVCAKAVA